MSDQLNLSENSDNNTSLTLRDHLAMERTSLASERTLLAYVRTAILLAGSGFTILTLEQVGSYERFLAGSLLLAGLVVILFGAKRFRNVRNRFLV